MPVYMFHPTGVGCQTRWFQAADLRRLEQVFSVALMLTALGALAASSLHVVWADQRLVVFRHGELTAVKGPGLAFVLPGVERGVRVPACDAGQLTTRPVPPEAVDHVGRTS
jgi:regulator of protease activity HflC (stomatin/prohibitin superfamily)